MGGRDLAQDELRMGVLMLMEMAIAKGSLMYTLELVEYLFLSEVGRSEHCMCISADPRAEPLSCQSGDVIL